MGEVREDEQGKSVGWTECGCEGECGYDVGGWRSVMMVKWVE